MAWGSRCRAGNGRGVQGSAGDVGPSERTNMEFFGEQGLGRPVRCLYLCHTLVSKHPGSFLQKKHGRRKHEIGPNAA